MSPGAGRKLEPPETLLDRPDRPAFIDAQTFDGLTCLIERTDIAQLDGVAASILDPPEGKPLGSADIRAVAVDSTGTLFVEERAGTFSPRHTVDEKVGVMAANLFSLYVKNRQPIDATRATSPPALEPRRMKNMQPVCFLIHVCVQNGGGVRRRA